MFSGLYLVLFNSDQKCFMIYLELKSGVIVTLPPKLQLYLQDFFQHCCFCQCIVYIVVVCTSVPFSCNSNGLRVYETGSDSQVIGAIPKRAGIRRD